MAFTKSSISWNVSSSYIFNTSFRTVNIRRIFKSIKCQRRPEFQASSLYYGITIWCRYVYQYLIFKSMHLYPWEVLFRNTLTLLGPERSESNQTQLPPLHPEARGTSGPEPPPNGGPLYGWIIIGCFRKKVSSVVFPIFPLMRSPAGSDPCDAVRNIAKVEFILRNIFLKSCDSFHL